MVPVPLPTREAQKIYSPVSLWKPNWALEVKLTKVWGPSIPQSLWNFHPSELSMLSSCQVQLRFFLPWNLFPRRCIVVDFFSSWPQFFAFAYWSLQLEGQQFTPWPHLSDRSKKICWFFSFLLSVRMKRWRRKWQPTLGILAWRIPGTEEPGRLPSMGLHRVEHKWSNLASCMHTLEKEMATHSSIVAWRLPGTEEPGGLLSVGSHRVRHDWCDLAAAAGWRFF